MVTGPQPASPAASKFLRISVTLVFTLFVALALKTSLHWPLLGDPQVIHYVAFLIHHGFAPYRETFDMNMPGAYLFEGWALTLFGPSDLGWRIYDLFLAATMAASMVVIARRYDWLAGYVAAVIFTLVHLADGPWCEGQRDFVIAVLLTLSCACLFASVRHRKPWLMLPFAFASTMAASIKPTMLPAGLVLLLIASFQLRRSATPLKPYWFCAVGGFALAVGIVAASLLQTHATAAFLNTLTQVVPHYGGLQRYNLPQMLARSLPLPVAIFVLLGILAAILRRSPQTWEEWCLLTFAAFGALSYLAQGKGFPQHRYTLLAFLLLWVCLQLAQAIHRFSPATCIAIAAILCALLYVCPRELARTRAYPRQDGYSKSLEADLTHLGTASLQHHVQCLDIIDGCLTSLYHLQIVQSTGATGDLTLFLPGQAPAIDASRALFLSLIERHPPAVYILSNAQFGVAPRSFNGKLATWPQFANLLHANYVPVQQRAFRDSSPTPTTLGQDSADVAYRIYIRRDSPLLHATPFHP